MGDVTDLVWGRIFFLWSSNFFRRHIMAYDSFSALYVLSDIFFGAGYFFLGIYLHAFFLSKSVCRTFFLKSPITPSKVKWSALKIHQTFGRLTDSNLSMIS